MVTMEKNHLHSCETWVRQSIEAVIAQLEAQLKELETRLAPASTQRPQWQERLAILTSVKGIGPVISQALLVHFKSQAEDFKLATGNYPESIHVDQIYRTKLMALN
jgi:ERCC4-type nuclease